MEDGEFQAIWKRATTTFDGHQFPLAQADHTGWTAPEPDLAAHIEKRRWNTAARQAAFIEDTRRQAELDLARLGWAEWLLVQGTQISAQHIHGLYVWADECAECCHP